MGDFRLPCVNVKIVDRFQEAQRKADDRRRAWQERQAELQAQRTRRFAGVTVKDGRISYKRTSGPLAGVTVRVETSGQIRERVTATRLVAGGIFAFAFKKERDDRHLYLVVEGDGFGFVADVDPDDRGDAERFAATVNGLARRASNDAAAHGV